MLTIAQAQRLIASIVDSPVEAVEHIANTNDVFKVATGEHGNYFVKFHTSSWYKDAADTRGVVQREAAVAEMLKRKGFPLEYHVWTDCSREIVSRSVLITSELSGMPVPTALREAPAEQNQIIQALAQFLKRLHKLEFPRAGYIEFSGDADLPFALAPPEWETWWNSHPCQKPENLRKFALGILDSKANLLPAPLFTTLKEYFKKIPERVGADYQPPHFVINNYHPFHIHVAKNSSGWHVTGLYDFEAASAGTAVFDVVGNELQLTPLIGDLSWRSVFYAAYGQPPLELYKTLLVCYLVLGLGEASSAEVPNSDWLLQKLPDLISATAHEEIKWYPSR